MSYLVNHWSFDPFLVIAGAIVVFHELGLRRVRSRSVDSRKGQWRSRSVRFYGGLGLLVLAVSSPIDYWSDVYFFVHMCDHLLLGFFIPILIVLGAPWVPLMHALPVNVRRRIGRTLAFGQSARPLRVMARGLRNPWFGLISFNVVMVLWHIPRMFDLAEQNQLIHIWLMHGSFLATGLLFWLQILKSHPFQPRMSPFWQMGAIIGTNVVMFVLAMAMSVFSSGSWYSVYAHVPGVTLSPFADQQIGAAILWICGDFWAVPALTAIIRRVIETEGSFSGAVERLIHRTPGGIAIPARISDPERQSR